MFEGIACCTGEICPTSVKFKPPERGYLDTLPLTSETGLKDKFAKRALRKAIGFKQVQKLLELNSPLAHEYKRTLWCGSHIKQSNGKLVSTFCGKRWCPVCSANRQGELINGYQQAFQEMQEPMFVTLTLPAVKAPELKATIRGMLRTFTLIKDSLRKGGIKLKGIRKVESNFNPDRTTFNPHFHVLLEGDIEAQALIHHWLNRHPEASPEAQDIQEADEGSLKELVKYTTKTIVGKRFYPEAQDTINRALKGVRTFQTYGGVRKLKEAPLEVSLEAPEAPETNDIKEPDTEHAQKENVPVRETSWWWKGNTWVNSEGYPLLIMVHSPNMERLLQNIRKAPLYQQLE